MGLGITSSYLANGGLSRAEQGSLSACATTEEGLVRTRNTGSEHKRGGEDAGQCYQPGKLDGNICDFVHYYLLVVYRD